MKTKKKLVLGLKKHIIILLYCPMNCMRTNRDKKQRQKNKNKIINVFIPNNDTATFVYNIQNKLC